VAKLVVLPLDKLALPGTAEEINAKLAQVRLPGVGDAVLATVSMETAQLQSECAEATETCYLKIARLVEADRLLWAQVEKVSGKGKKKAKKGGTRIQIILFDRDKLGVSGQSDETFAGPITGEELDKLIAVATGARLGQAPVAPAAPPPAAAPAPAAMAPAAARPAATAPVPAGRPAYAPQPAAPPATAPAPSVYQPPSAAPPTQVYAPPAAQPPPAAAPPPPAYAPPAASSPSYAPPAATPPSAPSPSPARWQ
jgi:hypothetical protein